MRILSVNGVHLLDRMDPNHAFITELASPSVGCITWPQRQHIIDIVQSRDRNDKLLEFLTRRSVADFEKFIKVLSKEQAHLVPLMVSNGGEIFVYQMHLIQALLCFIELSSIKCNLETAKLRRKAWQLQSRHWQNWNSYTTKIGYLLPVCHRNNS